MLGQETVSKPPDGPGDPILAPASMARSHSVSKVIDRLVKLAEPMRRKVSSITITFEWRSMWRCLRASAMGQ